MNADDNHITTIDLEKSLDALGASSTGVDGPGDRFIGAVRRRRRVRIIQRAGAAGVILAAMVAVFVAVRPVGPSAGLPPGRIARGESGLPPLTAASASLGILNFDASGRTPRIGDARSPELLAGVLAGV